MRFLVSTSRSLTRAHAPRRFATAEGVTPSASRVARPRVDPAGPDRSKPDDARADDVVPFARRCSSLGARRRRPDTSLTRRTPERTHGRLPRQRRRRDGREESREGRGEGGARRVERRRRGGGCGAGKAEGRAAPGEKRPETRQLQPAARQGCQKRGEEVRRLGRREGEATRAPFRRRRFERTTRGRGEATRARNAHSIPCSEEFTTNPVRSRSTTSRKFLPRSPRPPAASHTELTDARCGRARGVRRGAKQRGRRRVGKARRGASGPFGFGTSRPTSPTRAIGDSADPKVPDSPRRISRDSDRARVRTRVTTKAVSRPPWVLTYPRSA